MTKGQWVLESKQCGRASKAVMRRAFKNKMKDKIVGCARVQSHNGSVSEVSCENCTHAAIAARKKCFYTHTQTVGEFGPLLK